MPRCLQTLCLWLWTTWGGKGLLVRSAPKVLWVLKGLKVRLGRLGLREFLGKMESKALEASRVLLDPKALRVQ